MIHLNCDQNCEGVYAWERREQKSAIDLVMVNERMYGRFIKMMIDEKRESIEISDHCLLSVKLDLKRKENRIRKEWHEKNYYSCLLYTSDAADE